MEIDAEQENLAARHAYAETTVQLLRKAAKQLGDV